MEIDLPIDVPLKVLTQLCEKWHITQLAVFGSLVNGEFDDKSDVDVLVDFECQDTPSLFDFVELKEELEKLFGRSVDVLTRRAVESSSNQYRRKSILESAKVIYEKAAA